MGHTKTDYTKIDKIAKELGLEKLPAKGMYTGARLQVIDLTASGQDFESVAKNIIRQLQ